MIFYVVQPSTNEDLLEALSILSTYHVHMQVFTNQGDWLNGGYFIVTSIDDGDKEDDYRTSEICFQMTFHQDGSKHRCDHCRAMDETDEGSCGHLTFNKVIVPAF